MPLRPYQDLCLSAIEKEHKAGTYGQVVALSCGAGKTVVAANIPPRIFAGQGKHLFICNANELVLQAYDKFSALNPNLKVGIERADDQADFSRHDIIIASIQSLSRPSRLRRFEPGVISSLTIDECHGSLAESYQEVLRHLRCLKSEPDCDVDTLLTGISATPFRSDNRGLELLYSKISFSRSIVDLMKDGVKIKGQLYPYLVDLQAHRIDTYCDISSVKTSHGDLDDHDLAAIVDNKDRNALVVKGYRDFGEGLPGLCFTVDIAHAVHLCEEFNASGIAAVPMTGDTPPEERKRLFAAFRDGSVKILASAGVLTQGVDIPEASVGLLCKPHRSALPYVQKVGRLQRPWPAPEQYAAMVAAGTEPPWIKRKGIILDFCDVSSRHSLLTVASLFGLRNEVGMGDSALETLSLIEDLEEKSGKELRDCKSIREMRSVAEAINLFETPVTPPEIRRLSKLSWISTGSGRYCLSLMGNQSIRIAETALGQWEVSTYNAGIKQVRWVSESLAGAISAAEKHYVPQQQIAVLRDGAGWHRDCCTPEQATAVFRADSRVRIAHKDSRDFYEYAKAEFGRGNQSYSKGSMSRIISSFAVARPAWLSAKIASRTKKGA